MVDGTSYDTLVVSMGSDKPVTRLLVDPKTHLIRRAVTDRQADLRRRGAQVIVPRHCWQTAKSLGDWTLVGCTVAPGFQFSGFEMAKKDWEPGK